MAKLSGWTIRGPTGWGDRASFPAGGRCRKSGTRAMYCHTAWAQWAAELFVPWVEERNGL